MIIIFHGGTEHDPFPSPGQKLRYRELINFGADAVVGMHTHCPQGYEIYHGAPIIYSVGNFLFPRKYETPFANWKVGYVAKLTFQKGEKIAVKFVPYKFDIYGECFSAIDQECFRNYLGEISEVIQDEVYLGNLYKAWAAVSGKIYFEKMCECVKNMEDRKNLAVVKNSFSCEAHNELLKTYLGLYYENEIEEYGEYINVIKRYMRFFGRENETENKSTLRKEKVIIWGISKKAESFYYKMRSKKDIVFADKSPLKQGLLFCGKSIISPEEVISNYKNADIYICTTEKSAWEIKKFLKDNHVIWKEN